VDDLAAHEHEHQFPEVNQSGTLVAYPCLLCGLSAGDALKAAAEDRLSFQSDIERDVEVIRELHAERDANLAAEKWAKVVALRDDLQFAYIVGTDTLKDAALAAVLALLPEEDPDV